MAEPTKQRSLRSLALKTAVGMALAVVAFGVSVSVYGAFRTEPVQGRASVEVRAPVEAVFGVMADPRRFPDWRTDVDKIHDYRESDGLGAWTEVDSRGGEQPLRMREMIENERLVILVDDEYALYRGEWTFTFEATGNGTRVSVREVAEVSNAFVRGMFHLLGNRAGAQQAHLNALKAHAERMAAS
jgi:uncharacterized protein YndB with AHSA1/START domain